MKPAKKKDTSERHDIQRIFPWLIVLLIIASVAFSPALQNGFTNWDDDEQLYENPNIRSLSSDNIKTIFSSYYAGMYQPFTTLLFAVEYKLYGLNPKGYHGVSLFFHLLNSLLVFYLFRLLTRRKDVPLVIAVVFVLHPMNVEAVAWISARSTTMFTCFFLFAAIFYIKYIRNNYKIRLLLLSLLFFTLSLLSKSAAVSLPLLLILIDFFHSRKYSLRNFTRHSRIVFEKIPFFLFSGFFGILTLVARDKASHISEFSGNYSVIDTFFMVCHSIVRYIIKLLFPFNLSAFYPYPQKTDGFLPVGYYLSALVIAALVWIIIRQKKYRKEIIFGTFFFLITIFLMLKIMPVGNQIISDRYVYIPGLGFFFVLCMIISDKIPGNKKQFRLGIIGFLPVYLFVFAYLTHQRTKVWKDSLVLWNDVLEKFPDVQEAWNNRGDVNYKAGDFKAALEDYNKAVKLDPTYERFYSNRGSAKESLGDYQGALDDFNKAIELNPVFPTPYLNRGIVLSKTGDYPGAIKDYTKTIELDPGCCDAYLSRGSALSMQQDYTGAINDFSRAIDIRPDNHLAWSNRGIARSKINDIQGAVNDFTKAIQLKPDFADPYSNRGYLKMQSGNFQSAISDYNIAISLNPSLAVAYMNRAMALVQAGKTDEACKDFAVAYQLGIVYAEQEMKKHCP
ncbi:MAG: tetratricopeptide repeat protein [Bacteroidota bacterium]